MHVIIVSGSNIIKQRGNFFINIFYLWIINMYMMHGVRF